MQTTTAMSDALGQYLDLTSRQMQLTASNMANVDTPGYKTQGFDFEQEFARQLNNEPKHNLNELNLAPLSKRLASVCFIY